MREHERRDRRYQRLQAAVRAYRSGLLLAVIVILILSSILLAGRGRFARAIKINGEVAVLVRNKAAADRVREQLLKAGKKNLPGQASFEEQWEDAPWPVEGRKVLSIAKALEVLRPAVTVLVSSAAIEVDGQEVVVLATEELAKKALDEVKRKYFTEDDKLLESPKFRQDVRIAPQVPRPAEEVLTDLSVAVEQLTESRTAAKTYRVKKGEFPAQIAHRHGMTLSHLYALNPGIRDRYLIIGEKLKVSTPAAPLTVVTVKEETRTKVLPPEKQEIRTPILPRGQTEVAREGKPGKKTVWMRVVYENNRVISKKDIRGRTIEEPEPRIVRIGIGEATLSRTESED